MILVFDSNALIAYLRLEAGALVVRALLADPGNLCFVHAVNLCELFSDFRRAEGESVAQAVLQTLLGLPLIVREDMDEVFWQDAGRLKADHRRVALADCFCLALAQRLATEVVTSDHREFDPLVPLGLCPIQFIR